MMRNKDALIEYRNECTLNMKRGEVFENFRNESFG